MRKSLYMVIFHSYVTNYQRVLQNIEQLQSIHLGGFPPRMTNFLDTGCWLLVNSFQENCFKWCEHTELGPIMFDPNFIVMFKILSGNMPVQLQVLQLLSFSKKYRVFPLYLGQSSIKWLVQMSSSTIWLFNIAMV